MATTAVLPKLHLMKLAVGCETPEDLAARQNRILARDGQLRHWTRQCPRRQDELLAGGSLFWVIRGQILLRQRLLGVDVVPASESEGRSTVLLLDPRLQPTEAQAQRPFQGWRYLRQADAPADLDGGMDGGAAAENEAMPAALRAELRALGLL